MSLPRRLRTHGLRMTGQRLTIAQSLERLGGFPTAHEVLADAGAHRPGISKATVYNALTAFAASGEIRQIGGKGERSRYAVSDAGVTTTVMSRDGFMLDEAEAADLPIERVQITYIVAKDVRPVSTDISPVSTDAGPTGTDIRPEAMIEAPPTSQPQIDLRPRGRTSRPTDPVFRVA